MKPIDHDLVQPEIGNEREAVGLVKRDRVGMGARLADGIDTRTLMLHEAGGLSQPATLKHRQNADAATHKIGHQDTQSILLHADMAWVGPTSQPLVQELKLSRPRVHRKRGDG